MAQTKLQRGMAEEDFGDFLRHNPDIFQRHPELLEFVNLSDGRSTSSMLERQVETLRSLLSKSQSQQVEFIDVARQNEQISDSLVQIICRLIGFNNLSEFATEFPKALRDAFEINEVAVKTTQAVASRPKDNRGYEDALRRLANQNAVCDNRWPSSILALFFTESVKSAALIPMRSAPSGEILGILALGSFDAERYTIELGTAHLDRLSLMSGICLSRLQPLS